MNNLTYMDEGSVKEALNSLHNIFGSKRFYGYKRVCKVINNDFREWDFIVKEATRIVVRIYGNCYQIYSVNSL